MIQKPTVWETVGFGVLVGCCVFFGLLRQKRGRGNRTPNFLISSKFSLETSMYVDHVGIDGEFMLKWSRVLTFEQVDTVTYKLTYRRKPMWLMTALKANELIIRFELEEDSQKFKDTFEKFRTLEFK
ncbi:MAG: hypothetical protein ACI92I_000620 [Acidimicrobiales bacterium]